MSVRRLGLEDGLSQITVNAIVQDSNGLMWFATRGGLNRFDSYDIEIISSDPDSAETISDDEIISIIAASDGAIWAGTARGLDRIDPTSGVVSHSVPADFVAGRSGDARVLSLIEDHDGTLWLGTAHGVIHLDPSSGDHEYVLVNDDLREVRAIAQEDGGQLWFGGAGGLVSYEPDSKTAEVFRHDESSTDSLRPGQVWTIAVDPDGVLWIGTDSGLDRFDPETRRFSRVGDVEDGTPLLLGTRVRSLVLGRTGEIWAATDGAGLARIIRSTMAVDVFKQSTRNPTWPPDHLRGVFIDRDGAIWLGSWFEGALRLNPDRRQFVHVRHGPNDPSSLGNDGVAAILEDRTGLLWVGTVGGLSVRERDGSFQNYSHEPGNPASLSDGGVFALLESRDGRIWIGTGGGLNRYDRSKRQFMKIRSDPYDSSLPIAVTALAEDQTGQIWVGTWGTGLFRYDSDSGTLEPIPGLENDKIRVILIEPDSSQWLGTSLGLKLRNPDTGQVRTFAHKPGDPTALSADFVMALAKNSQGTLMIGTAGGGLNRLESRDGVFTHFTERDGLANNHVYGILEDDESNLWLTTNRGVSRYDPRDSKWATYTPADGLQGFEFVQAAVHRGSSGVFYLGGPNGLNEFEPSWLDRTKDPGPLVLTSASIFNHVDGVRTLGGGIARLTLGPDDDFFSVEFASLTFDIPNRTRYSYRLEGLERDWLDAGESRTARYTNVPAGDYVFLVRTASSNGDWSVPGLRLEIKVIPPIWQTWSFRAVMIAIFLASLLVAHRLRTRALKAKADELTVLVSEKTSELAKANTALERLALVDELTGVANLRRFRQVLDREWRRAIRSQAPLSLVLLDIDHFKRFNDFYGHARGDRCLAQVATTLSKAACRPGDLVARCGGEEFAVILADTPLEAATRIAESLVTRIEALGIPHLDSPSSDHVTISAGVAMLVPQLSQTPTTLFEQADRALYDSKEKGRNQTTVFGEPPGAPAATQ